MKKIFIAIIIGLSLPTISVLAQKDLVMSQYMHNRYSINPAFAGNREALSLFGSFRKKWVGINGSPHSEYFSAHSPLKNANVALGVDIYNQQFGVSRQSGFTLSYTYRVKLNERQRLGLGLNAGYAAYAANWSSVPTFDDDPAFAYNENGGSPLLGFGVSWYSNRFFLGLSAPSLFHYNLTAGGESSFAPDKVNYILTGGYLFSFGDHFDIQPSFLTRYNATEDSHVDINSTFIYDKSLWLGFSYRTTKEIVGLLGYQVSPQMRLSYSFDYSTGQIGSYNSGTHEIAVQFDFGYKVKTPNPKFF